ncbi:MAG: protein-disulfide reductase DsbD [Caldimonas sp.]
MNLRHRGSLPEARALVAWLGALLVVPLFGFASSAAPQALPERPPAAFSSPPASQSRPSPASTGSLIETVKGWLTGGPAQPDLLPPDEAYKLSIRAQSVDTLVATLTPADGYYLYRDRIKFVVEDPPGVTVDSVSLPRGEMKEDATFGKTEVYHRPVDAVIRLAPGSTRAASVRLHATYQGCNEPLGVCYPPIDKSITVALDALSVVSAEPAGTTTASSGPRPESAVAAPSDASDASNIQRLFSNGGSWTLLAAFFGFGLLLAFTPCMLPMIPILSGIIIGQDGAPTKRRALGLSMAYVLGMALTYAAAGVAAGLAGSMLSAALQNPWTLGAFAAVFVLLSLSMFGLYELQLPTSLQSALASASRRIPGGQAAGVFLMGVVSAVIVGPCVAAPLAGALLYISQTGDAGLGGTALFVMALGMGVPLLFVGATAGTLLRRSGPWTRSIKRFFGVTMLALAIFIVSPVISLVIQQLLWASLLIVSAMFVHAIDPLPVDAAGVRRLFKGFGVIGLLAGAALLVGALSGSHDLLRPLSGIGGAAMQASSELPFRSIKTVADLDARIASASGRFVMLDFWAEWCVSCKEMDRFTFGDSRVQARLKNTLLLRADVTANNADDRALLRRFGLFGPPGIIFFDPRGKEVPYRVIGYESADKFLTSLDRALVPVRQELIGQR